jgi:hypothetical protein
MMHQSLTRCIGPHPNALADMPEHGAPSRVYMFRYIVPTLREGIRLLKANEPEKPLKGLGDLFLGVDSISDCVRVGSSRNVVAVCCSFCSVISLFSHSLMSHALCVTS